MTLVVSEQQPAVPFYEPDQVHNAEAERLEHMANYADIASLAAVTEVTDQSGAVCVDIGAGDSTSLGKTIKERNATARYMAVDMREDAVRGHAAAGHEAYVGFATDLPVADNVADVLHARFTLGWLDNAGRTRVIEEMLRVGHDHAKLAIIDYDWSTAHGPEPANRLVGGLTSIMRNFGFDPYFGAKAADDLKANLAEYGYTEQNTRVEVQRTHIQETMSDSLGTIEMTAQPVIDKLAEVGLADHASSLSTMLDEVRTYARNHPNEVMHFPDIVAVTAHLEDEGLHAEALNRIHSIRTVGAETLRHESMVAVGPQALETYRLPQSMLLQARRLHASAYRNYGHVTEEGLNPDGTLIEDIDPQSIIDASTYLGAVNSEGTVTGGIRVVKAENGDVRNLPTMVKTIDALGEDNPTIQELPFMQEGAQTSEASALGKSNQAKDPLVLSKLLLAAWVEAKEQGDDYMVMTIVESTARVLLGAFGDNTFKRIDGDTAVVRLKGKGIREEGVTLVPFYVHIDSFIDTCKRHFAKRPDSDFTKSNLPLFNAAEEFVRTRG
ncbi:MAG: class I SAM-dependent methyltransferase [Candidatus Saccharimonadales bacterium]